MRYLISNEVSNDEIRARIAFLQEIFNIYIVRSFEDVFEGFLVYESFPKQDIDLFMIIGHNIKVDNLMISNYKKIYETNIVFITCFTENFYSTELFKEKNIFFPKTKGIEKIYNGSDFGFDFDITDEELYMYNNRKNDLDILLDIAFRRKK